MTQGFMNCGTTIAGKQCTVPCDDLSWYRVLGRHLQSGLPGCRVTMLRSTSRGGRTVTTAQRFDTRVKRSGAHIVITDLTVCDLRGVTSSLDEVRVQAGMEVLVRRTLSDDAPTALLHMESWSELNPMGACKGRAAHRLHLPVAQHYGVPAASFMLGVCATRPESALRRHWRGGCSPNASACQRLDTIGSECEPHPGPHTHRVFALVLAERILGEAVEAAGSMADPEAAAGAAAATAGSSLRRPTPLNESVTPTLLPPSALAALAACRAHHGTGNPLATLDFAEGACGEPAQNGGWRCYSDRPGKPGWISEVSSHGGHGDGAPTLSFSMPLGSSKLTVGYLRSYDARMGVARVWLDDDTGAAVLLNGSWASRTSQTDILSARVSGLCRETCRARRRGEAHEVHVQRFSGRKFKLLLLEVC